VQVYPNPFNGSELNIKLYNNWDKNVTISIIDVHGRLMDKMESTVNNGHVVWQSHAMTNIKKGVYLIRISDNNKTFNTMLIIK
jgi:hypothetical protein